MTTPSTPHQPSPRPDDHAVEHLDQDLVPIARALDRLAAADAAASGANFELRVLHACTIAADNLGATQDLVARAALSTRAQAPADLEDRIASSTLASLVAAPSLALSESTVEPKPVARVRRVSRWRTGYSLAAAAVFVIGCGLAYLQFGAPASTLSIASSGAASTPTTAGSTELARRVGSEMDLLLRVVDESAVTTSTTEAVTDPDAAWIESWLSDGQGEGVRS